jgi:hypothetical protein
MVVFYRVSKAKQGPALPPTIPTQANANLRLHSAQEIIATERFLISQVGLLTAIPSFKPQ